MGTPEDVLRILSVNFTFLTVSLQSSLLIDNDATQIRLIRVRNCDLTRVELGAQSEDFGFDPVRRIDLSKSTQSLPHFTVQ